MKFQKGFRLQRRCVHTVPRVRRPSRPNVESLSGHQGEHWFAKEGFKSQMTNYFQYPHPQQPPRRNCRLLKKLFRFIIILSQIKLKLKWNYQVDPDTKTSGNQIKSCPSHCLDIQMKAQGVNYINMILKQSSCSDNNSLFNLCIFILQYEFCKYNNSSVLQACLLSLNINLGVLWSSHHTSNVRECALHKNCLHWQWQWAILEIMTWCRVGAVPVLSE